jgi:phenylpropionate dioxygenase-like ring-hydroxylating dioxygenase large terminal subunit
MNLVDTKALDTVKAPIERARGLPNAFYTDEDVFEAEKRVLFAQTWAAVGFGKDVPGPGDVKPVEFLGQPLLLVRGKDMQLKVFQNVCRHRGMILVSEPTTLNSAIRCPYHSWCYNFDGSLRTTPHVGGPGKNLHDCVNREELGLLDVRSELFMDIIFVNMDGKAPAFREAHAKLFERWREYVDQPLFHGGEMSSFSLAVKTNWKLAVENYCESYHLPWVHPGLNSYSRLEDHYNIVEPLAFSGQGTLVYDPKLDDTGRAFSLFGDLSDKWDKAAEYIALYPNVLLGVHKDHTFAIMLDPVAQDRTIERIEIYYASEDMLGDDLKDLRETHAAMWKEVFIEDIFVVEGMQKGRSASLFDGGKFSPVMDNATHCFHEWVAERFSLTS